MDSVCITWFLLLKPSEFSSGPSAVQMQPGSEVELGSTLGTREQYRCPAEARPLPGGSGPSGHAHDAYSDLHYVLVAVLCYSTSTRKSSVTS